jgi:hypothetical protein
MELDSDDRRDAMSSKKARINKGKHIIVSTDVHSRLKVLCTKAGVQVMNIADEALLEFVKNCEQADAMGGTEERDKMLREMASRSLARNPPTATSKRTSPIIKSTGEPLKHYPEIASCLNEFPQTEPTDKVEEPKGADVPVKEPASTN